MPWIKLVRVKHIRKAGTQQTYRPGDSVEVGRQTALEWILDGSAEDPYAQIGPPVVKGPRSRKFGVVVRAPRESADLQALGTLTRSLTVSYGPPAVPYEYTLIWRPDRRVEERLVNYGFYSVMEGREFLAWEMAAGLYSLTVLAKDVGSPEERAKTEEVIGDLRLPVYDSRVVWARKCEASERMAALWAKELEVEGVDEYHAFLRALYASRAMLCTLPADWTTR